MLKMRREKKDVTINMRQLRCCCVELALSNPHSQFVEIGQIKDFIEKIDKSVCKMDESTCDADFIDEAKKFSSDTMMKIISFFKKGPKEFIATITQELLMAVEGAAEKPLSCATDKQRTRYENCLRNLKNSISDGRDTEFRNSITRLFSSIVKKEEIHLIMNSTIDNKARVLASFLNMRECLGTLSSLFERICADPVPFVKPISTPNREVQRTISDPVQKVSKLLPPKQIQGFDTPKPKEKVDKQELQDEIEKLKDEITELTKEKTEAEEQRDNYMVEKLEYQGYLNDAKAQLDDCINRINQLYTDLNQKEEDVNKLNEKISNLNEENKAHEQELLLRIEELKRANSGIKFTAVTAAAAAIAASIAIIFAFRRK